MQKNKKYNLCLFIFRRDLRLQDNTALFHAAEQSNAVLPIFIFDPQQVDNQNSYKSNNAVQFMVESLEELKQKITQNHGHLNFFYAKPEQVVAQLFDDFAIDALFINADYTPFALDRDLKLKELCAKKGVDFCVYHDALLHNPEQVLSNDNKPYALFTAYYNKARKLTLPEPIIDLKISWYAKKIKNKFSNLKNEQILPVENKMLHIHGGNRNAHKLLSYLPNLSNYEHTHNIPSLQTSNLSAHLKFGTVSARQVLHAIKDKLSNTHPLIRQLYWRDFFTMIAFFNPRVFGHAYKASYQNLPWQNDKTKFAAWCQGKTGFPIVDAGMRQLNQTGFMHNRVRMIVASFLVKDLHIDWRWGEKYFAKQLVDYDPAVNNGNWQWCASTGADAQPYFRIFNPWLQQKKFDPQCLYIKQWVNELKTIEPRIIHTWFKENSPKIAGYPRPIVNHAQEAALAKKIYKQA